MAPLEVDTAPGHGRGPWPVAPPLRGRIRPREARRGAAPMAPPNLGFILVRFTGKFINILGLIGW